MLYVLKSKTVWFNIVTTIVGIVSFMISQPAYQNILPWLALINAAGNIILRIWFTSQSVTFSKNLDSRN